MTTESPASVANAWPILGLHERRVLGVLVEKAKTTPDVYPLSVNALVAGCNQKSNRDPLLDLSDVDVEETLVRLQKLALAIKITGGRVVRWRHNLYEAWKADKVELAVLAELLLRGPQTEGELRGRASRMEPIDDLDTLRAVLKRLAERKLIIYLSPEGRRGAVVTHGFHAPEELQHLRERHQEAALIPINDRAAPTVSKNSWDEAHAELASLRTQVAELQAAVRRLTEQMQIVKESLGL